MVLNNVKSCVDTLTENLKFDNNKFSIREINLDGEEMSITDERISCMICTSNDIIGINKASQFDLFCKEIESHKNFYAGKDCIIVDVQLPFYVDKNGNLL